MLLRSPKAAFKRRLMGVLEHPEPPPGYTTGFETRLNLDLDNLVAVIGWEIIQKIEVVGVENSLCLSPLALEKTRTSPFLGSLRVLFID